MTAITFIQWANDVDTPPAAGFKAWYDATAITGVADGASLTSWPDSSGNGWHLTLGTPPTYSAAGIGGKPSVDFDGTSQFLATATNFPTAVADQPFLVFAVALCTDLTGSNGIWGTWECNMGTVTTSWSMSGPVTLAGGSVDGGAHVVTSFHTGAGVAEYFRIDGVQTTSGAPVSSWPTTTGGPIWVGWRGFPSSWWHGSIAEVILYSQAAGITATQITDTEAYLKAKWGTP